MNAAGGEAELERFRSVIVDRLGLHFEDGRLGHLAEVLRERLAACASPSFDAYVRRVEEHRSGELGALAERLTVGETYFFRYLDHFRAFAEVVLPDRAGVLQDRKKLRVLSAGCASGEEAYSLAILVREHLAEHDSWEVDLRGVDVNPAVIQKARQARYSAWSLRETPADLRERYFRAEGRDFALDDTVRRRVSFEQRNLLDDDPRLWRADGYDVVFCRNVLMYFAPEVMRAVVERITRSLSPGGFLFLGHAETLRGISHAFHLCHTHGAFYYQLREGSAGAILHDATASPGSAWPPAATNVSAALGLSDSSWVDVIQRASARIETLSRQPAPAAGSGASAALSDAPSWDLRPAVEMLRQERFAEAMDLLHALPAGSRADPDAQLLRAVLFTNSGRLPEAEQVCRQILDADGLSAGAHYLMALCREHAGDGKAAKEHDQTAAYLDPSFAMPHLHLGLLARRAANLEQARAELGLALTLLDREDASRVLLFGGGFSRDALGALCRSELRRCQGAP